MATLPASLKCIRTTSKCTNKSPMLQRTIHSGWMWKKGAINQLANRRWFELKGDQLYYFKDKGETHILGQITLAGNEIRRHSTLADSNSGKYVFELVAGEKRKDRPVYENQGSLIFGTATPYEMEDWIKAINRIIYTPDGGGMFGRPLNETIKIDSRRGGAMVPIIVEKCVEYLKVKAISEEGVFRVPGLKEDVEQLKTSFNKGEIIDFASSGYKVNIVTSVLKQYIGDLPESVIPSDYYKAFISIGRGSENAQSDIIDKYKDLLKKIPIENFNLLKYLCRFLHHLQSYEDVTKMSLSNLSLIFGPNILRPQDKDPALLLKSLTDVNATTMTLITYQEDLFPILDNEYYYQPVEGQKHAILTSSPRNMLYNTSEQPEEKLSSLAAMNLLFDMPEQLGESTPTYLVHSPSETFLDKKQILLPKAILRRSRSAGNLFTFVKGLEETPACSGSDYYDWTTHLKNELQEEKNCFQKQIQELVNKLEAEVKIREMLKLRLADEYKARLVAEERLEMYRVGIEEYCKVYGHCDISIP